MLVALWKPSQPRPAGGQAAAAGVGAGRALSGGAGALGAAEVEAAVSGYAASTQPFSYALRF